MECETVGCVDMAVYTRIMIVRPGFSIKIQLCKNHFLRFDANLADLGPEQIKDLLDNAVMAPVVLV